MHVQCKYPNSLSPHICKYMSHVHGTYNDNYPIVANVPSFYHSYHHVVHVSIYCEIFLNTLKTR